MVSLIQSNYTGFGSGYVVPALGFGIHNRGSLFSLKTGHPNSLEPGKRPFQTIIPAFVTKDGQPLMAFGLMGGDMQPQGHVQVVVNLVDFGMNLQEAGDAIRFHHTGSSEPTGTVMKDGGELLPRGRAAGAGPRGADETRSPDRPGTGGRLRRLPGDRPRPGDRLLPRGHGEAEGRGCRRFLIGRERAPGAPAGPGAV